MPLLNTRCLNAYTEFRGKIAAIKKKMKLHTTMGDCCWSDKGGLVNKKQYNVVERLKMGLYGSLFLSFSFSTTKATHGGLI